MEHMTKEDKIKWAFVVLLIVITAVLLYFITKPPSVDEGLVRYHFYQQQLDGAK